MDPETRGAFGGMQAQLDSTRGQLVEIRSDLPGFQGETRHEFARVRREMAKESANLRREMAGEFPPPEAGCPVRCTPVTGRGRAAIQRAAPGPARRRAADQ